MADDTLLNYLKKYLRNSGYPLEMQVARGFGRRLRGRAGKLYVDMNTNSLREVDVVAFSRRAMSFYPGEGWAELRLVIECKHSDKPWLIAHVYQESQVRPLTTEFRKSRHR